jgi:hypothetical protein
MDGNAVERLKKRKKDMGSPPSSYTSDNGIHE